MSGLSVRPSSSRDFFESQGGGCNLLVPKIQLFTGSSSRDLSSCLRGNCNMLLLNQFTGTSGGDFARGIGGKPRAGQGGEHGNCATCSGYASVQQLGGGRVLDTGRMVLINARDVSCRTAARLLKCVSALPYGS